MEQDRQQYKKYLEIQEKEREEIVNKIKDLVNDQSHAFSPMDAEKTLGYIDSNRLIAKDFRITKELFKILLSELERIKRQGPLFEIVKCAYMEKERKHQSKLEDCQKRLQNILQN